MTDDQFLGELLERYENQLRLGIKLSVEEICKNCPERIEEIRKLIEGIDRIGRLLRPADPCEPDLPKIGAPGQPLYNELEYHGCGGQGEVFKGRDRVLGRLVAIKTIQARLASSPTARRRFEREAAITSLLEHPGIPPVYTSDSCDDKESRPYYAMRFIEGETLKEKIGPRHGSRTNPDAGTPPPRTESLRDLLGRFIQVCQTIQYAHEQNVVHRDIKPDNVICRGLGETVVLDWGLAKNLLINEPENPDEPSGSSHEAVTEAGKNVPGTPGYMAPERIANPAAGDTAASDIYSLGATLSYLLTGRHPRHGTRIDRLAGVDAKLESICLKAMATRPEDRYARASDLSDDVARWLAGAPVSVFVEPWWERAGRWVNRRPKAAAAILVTIIAGAIVFGAVAFVRNRERNRIAIREALAIDAVRKFGDALVNEPELKNSPSLKALRKRLLQEPLAFFGSLRKALQADDSTGPESLENFGRATYDLAMINNEIGDRQVAINLYKEAIAVYRELVKTRPSDVKARRNLANVLNNLGLLLIGAGDEGAARSAYLEALSLRRKLAEEHLGLAESLSDLAATHHNLGELSRATGKYAEALDSFRKAMPLFQKLAEENPSVGRYQSQLATCLHNIGNVLRLSGEPAKAIESYREARSIHQVLVDEYPAAGEYRRQLGLSHNNIAGLLAETGQAAEAFKSYDEALSVQKKLAADFPSVSDYQLDLARTYNDIGLLYSESHKPEQAGKPYRESLLIHQKLAADDPSVTDYRKGLAGCIINLGLLHVERGEMAEALKSYREALPIFENLVKDSPEVVRFLSDLAVVHYNIGELLYKMERNAEAFQSIGESVKLSERLLAFAKHSPDVESMLGAAIGIRAKLELRAGRNPEAQSAAREAIKWQEIALNINDQYPFYRECMTDHINDFTIASKRLNDAAALMEAERQREKLERSDPEAIAIEARLPAVLRGETQPKDNAERLKFADLAYRKRFHAGAVKLWSDALEADSKLRDDRSHLIAYNAACSAALAASGQSNDAAALDQPAKRRLRESARDWLRGELAIWSKLLRENPSSHRAKVFETLNHWKNDSDLASIRDAKNIETLPESERNEWRVLWADVDALLDQSKSRLNMDSGVVPTIGRSGHPGAVSHEPGRYERTRRIPGRGAKSPGGFLGEDEATITAATRTLPWC